MSNKLKACYTCRYNENKYTKEERFAKCTCTKQAVSVKRKQGDYCEHYKYVKEE